MIETVTINGRETNISLNADSITLPERGGHKLFLAGQLAARKKSHYLESEGFVYFEEQPALSIAAQLVRWVHTDISVGPYRVLLPFDTVVYSAAIQVHEDYILVENEALESFEQALALIKANPETCQVGQLGKLGASFEQHRIELQDLRMELEPGAGNPYRFRRGYTLGHACLGLGLLIGLLCLGIYAVGWLRAVEPAPLPRALSKPESNLQARADMQAVQELVAAFSVLLAYELRSITVSKAPKGYNTSAAGAYRSTMALPRLEELAKRLQGRVIVSGDGWTLNSSLFIPRTGVRAELLPLQESFEQYRQLAQQLNADYRIMGVSRGALSSIGVVQLTFARPTPTVLARCVELLEAKPLHGALQTLELTTQPHAAWDRLVATMNITGR